MPSFLPTTVPISVRFGCSGAGGRQQLLAGQRAAPRPTAGAGGRRDGVNSGRSRVRKRAEWNSPKRIADGRGSGARWRRLIQIDAAAIALNVPIRRSASPPTPTVAAAQTAKPAGRAPNDHFVPFHWPDTAINTFMRVPPATAEIAGLARPVDR